MSSKPNLFQRLWRKIPHGVRDALEGIGLTVSVFSFYAVISAFVGVVVGIGIAAATLIVKLLIG